MKVLVVSALSDPHASVVMEALAARGDAEAELLDLSAFPVRMSLSLRFDARHHDFWLSNANGSRLDLSTIGSVWWRRPQPFGLPEAMTDPVHRRFALSEAHTAFRGLFQSLDAYWVNQPEKDALAAHKPWQLTLAQQVGLEIPVTLMTSEPAAAESFWREHEGNVIYKQFLALPDAWRETRRLRPQDANAATAVRHAPVIFQKFVEADADIRVIVIGSEIFAASTDVRNAQYPTDVRLNLDARYEPYMLPSSVADNLLTMMRRLGLEYGAIDMRRTLDGRHVFLEINPAGQFLYVELMTGQRIAAALASHLVRSSRKASI